MFASRFYNSSFCVRHDVMYLHILNRIGYRLTAFWPYKQAVGHFSG
jgi:hypothetical protein